MGNDKKLTTDAVTANSKAEEIKTVEAKQKKKANKKEGFFKRTGKKIKEVFSEIKLVSWPTFGKVVKQTGVVILVVVAFLACVALFDWPLSVLLKMLTGTAG